MPLVLHVEDEAKSTEHIYVMWCGAACYANLDGTLIPELDFYLESAWYKSNCDECVKRKLGVEPMSIARKERV